MHFIHKITGLLRRPVKVVDLDPVEVEIGFNRSPSVSSICVDMDEFFISARDALQLSIAALEKESVERARIGLTLLVLVNNPQANLSVERLSEASAIVDIMPDILLSKAQELIDGLLRSPESTKRRLCREIVDINAVRSALGANVTVHRMRRLGQ